MKFINTSERNPADKGRYHVKAYLDYLGRIKNATLVWSYGFWHIGRRDRVVEWLDEKYKEEKV